MNPITRHIDKAIASVGHAIIGTHDLHNSFAYTIGLTEIGLPELIICGMNQQYGAMFLNQAAAIMKESGAFADGTINGDLAHLPCGFKDVTVKQASGHALQAIYRYEDTDLASKLRFIQFVIPDKIGFMPWQEGYDAAYMNKYQPRLWEIK
jgi:hypothetical protein